ncbi:MAG: zinc ribbon domain-containing protein [Bacillota bacterium]
MNKKSIAFIISLLAFIAIFPLAAAFTPHSDDTFTYYEVTDLGSGTGDYAGYTEHTTYNGTEAVTGVSSDGTVSTHYSYRYFWRNSSGSIETGNPSGDFTFSSRNFLYINGTDDQNGYENPTVWFAMDNSIPVGGTFTLLDTQMTVISRNYSYYLSSQNKYISTIFAQGSSNYQRNDIYGQFNAAYTWNVYFDFATGYIVGYTYEEYDTSPSAGFKYTENLSVTSTSYPLTSVPAGLTPSPTIYISPSPRPPTITQFMPGFILLPAFVLVIVIVFAFLYAVSRGSKKTLPRHSYEQPYQQPPPPPGLPPENINLTPRQPPVQQIVIREVVKVKCRYCGSLIDSTAQTCPFCGAPRT